MNPCDICGCAPCQTPGFCASCRDTDRKQKPPPSLDSAFTEKAEIGRLAKLSPLQYDRKRLAAAEHLGVRVGALDKAVKETRSANPETKGQGRTFELPVIEPWLSPVDGAELLSAITDAIKRHVILPADSAETVALWALHTHCFNCFGHSPRAAITSPEKGCGKTTLLDVLECLVSRPLPTSSATVSSIFRVIEQAMPTLLIDEADTFLKENDELRGVLNTGHRRGGQVLRTVGEDHEPRLFSTWAPAAIAMIGRLPDTLNDRSVVIYLRRRKPEESVKPFRSDRADGLRVLARKMARWVRDHAIALTAADPDMGQLMNRVADNWRPLFAIADASGGPWPKMVRAIAIAADRTSADQSVSILLLQDIRWIFDGQPGNDNTGHKLDRISSAELVSQLAAIEGRPWAEWGRSCKPMTQNALARMLDKFMIKPDTIRFSGGPAKGYYRSAFEEAFSSYLANPTVTTVTLLQPNNDGHFCDFQSVTPDNLVTVQKGQKPNNDGHCYAVTVVTAKNGGSKEEEGNDDLSIPTFLDRRAEMNGARHAIEPCAQCRADDGQQELCGETWLHKECKRFRERERRSPLDGMAPTP
jgi:putative DNA primase/helicase